MSNYCPNCGSPVNPGVSFCPNCGASLTAPADPRLVPTTAPKTRPAPKKRGKTIVAVLVIILVLLVAAVALSGGNNDSTSSGSENLEASNSVVAVKVLEVRTTDDPAASPMDIVSPPDYGKHFVFVNVSVTNKGSGSEWYGPNMFHLFVGESSVEDLTHEPPDLDKTDYKTPEGVPIIPTTQPGGTVEFWIPYEVKDSMEPQKLVYINAGEESLTVFF